MKKRLAIFLGVMLLGLQFVFAQRQISGTVTSSEDGMGMPGVSVVVKGTTIGTTTDVNGKYVFSVPADATALVFTFVGMKQVELPITGLTVDAVLDPETKQIEEVVVVGYGVAKKSTFTGSAANVKTDEIASIPVTSVEKALKGSVTGLMSQNNSGQPGSTAQVTIRGIGSIKAGTEPLYIIDGVPVLTGSYSEMTTNENDNEVFNALSSFNPNDFETVTVLKDASATSIYGARASNGVILITTKKGKSGATKVNFKAQRGISSRSNKSFEILNTKDYLTLEIEARRNAGYSDATINNYLNTYWPVKNAAITDPQDYRRYYDTDWMSYAYNDKAITQSYDLSATGGNEKSNFYVSVSYFNQEGIVYSSDLERYSTRFNFTNKISDKLSFGTNSTLSLNNQGTPLTTAAYYSSPVAGSLFTAPFNPAKNDDGTWNSNIVGNNGVNFAANLAQDDISSHTYKVSTSDYVQYEPIKNLIVKTNWGVDFLTNAEKQWDDHRSKGNTAYGIGRASASQNEALTWIGTNTIGYTKTLSDVHNLDVLLGQEMQKNRYNYVYASAENFASYNLREVSSGATPVTTLGSYSEYSFVSFFSRLNYNYNNKYYFSSSFRRDGSSRFGKNNRYANFWSVGLSWRISDEEFVKNISQINNLQLRTSYGTSGNADIGNFASRGLYAFSAAYGDNPASYPYQLESPDLQWEKNANFNVGLDFRIFDRVSGTVEFYHKRTYDLLLDAPVSATSGFTSLSQNIGEMVNKGIEVSLEANVVKTNDFKWNVNMNLTSNKNEITELYNNEPIIDGFIRYAEGKSVREFYLKDWAGVNPADGRPMWYDANGDITFSYSQARYKYQGSALPKIYGSFGTNLSYKGVTLSASFYYQYGNKIYENMFRILQNDGAMSNFNQVEYAMDRWQKPGDVTDVPKRVYGNTTSGNAASSRWLLDGSYVRLKNVTLSYDLPKSIINKIKLDKLTIYAQGTNLWTSKYIGIDPEQSNYGDTWFQYPNAKSITFGLDLTF